MNQTNRQNVVIQETFCAIFPIIGTFCKGVKQAIQLAYLRGILVSYFYRNTLLMGTEKSSCTLNRRRKTPRCIAILGIIKANKNCKN